MSQYNIPKSAWRKAENQILNVNNKHLKRQNRLFYWTIFAFLLFITSCIASEYRNLLGFDPNFAGDNFAFNFMFLFPLTFICLLIMLFTGGLTIGYWRHLPNMFKKIVTLLLSFAVISFIAYTVLMILRLN